MQRQLNKIKWLSVPILKNKIQLKKTSNKQKNVYNKNSITNTRILIKHILKINKTK